MHPSITNVYGKKLRVRVCGLCWGTPQSPEVDTSESPEGDAPESPEGDEGTLLMVNHRGLQDTDFWAPPGGGLEFGESVSERLQKEFLEETGLSVMTARFLFGCEFIRDPLHAIELFFEVAVVGGALQKGNDPELPMIHEVAFMSPADIKRISSGSLHGIFSLVPTPGDLKTLSGFFRI